MNSQPPSSTLLLREPNASQRHLTFLYAGDIWVADRDGSHPRRLTVHAGIKASPIFSPDGAWIAYSAGSYERDISVYVVPVQGGTPSKLTHHPGHDWVQGWTPDGEKVLFSSTRSSSSPRFTRFFTIARTGGFPEMLPLPMAYRGTFSPDGTKLAYTRLYEPFETWKRYRGGRTLPIWIFDLASQAVEEIPSPNVNDAFPCWLGEVVYFLSDRNHTMNLFAFDTRSKEIRQLTHYEEFDVKYLSAGGGVLAYEWAGKLYVYDPATAAIQPIEVQIATDLPQLRPHYQSAKRFIHSAHISPSGARAVLEARGEILTVPAKKGDIRNISRTPGVHERDPAWSPDGKRIAYFSDTSGEYQLFLADQAGLEAPQVIDLGEATFYYAPKWSPDGTKILFSDKRLRLSYINIPSTDKAEDTSTENSTDKSADNRPILIDSDTYDHPERTLDPVWSPDSKWIAYSKRLDSHIHAIFLYDLANAQAHQITDGLSDATSPTFSLDGKYLFFAASTDYGLNTGWLDLSSYKRPVEHTLYVVVLNKSDRSPFFPESDEENAEEEKANGETKSQAKESDEQTGSNSGSNSGGNSEESNSVAATNTTGETSAKADNPDEKKKKEPVKVQIDLENIDQRILALPIPARNYSSLQAGATEKLFYLEATTSYSEFILYYFDLKTRKSELFLDKVTAYWMNYSGEKLLYRAPGNSFAIVESKEKPKPDHDRLKLNKLEVYVDPRAEWEQMFNEVCRIQRDFFYDAGMHGLDWSAICAKYRPFVQHIGHRSELNTLIAELISELVVGHAYVYGGDMELVEPLEIGLLGADYRVVDGYYQIERIYRGQNWHPELRSPLTEPGVNIAEGDYILAVNGRPLRAPTNLYELFENTSERITTLRVNSSPSLEGSRYVNVVPIANEAALRHWAWVEENRRKVHELTQGRVAYVYLPDTASGGYSAFNRYYFAQLDRQAVIVDERFNGGGFVADYIIDYLNRPLLSLWATREGKLFASPNASIYGPKVMIINEHSASGGDALAQFFRRRKIGTMVGKRTWGGLIGVYDYPTLMDGGGVTAPRVAIVSPEGEWEVENEGVAPDVEVEMTPAEVIAGHDPQLEKAIEIVLAQLEEHPTIRVPRPPSSRRAVENTENTEKNPS